MDKVIFSPIRYPGGKRWLFKTLLPLISEGTKEMVSPFFGGGAVELNLALRGVKVYGYDVFEPLVNFWQHYLDNPEGLVNHAKSLMKGKDKEYFRKIQRGGFSELTDNFDRACMYFLINRMSFNGSGLAPKSGIKPNHTECLGKSILDAISRLSIPNLEVKLESVFDLLKTNKSVFTYLDPPYPTLDDRLYGNSRAYHEGFNHKRLFQILNSRDNWILSYNDAPLIQSLYKDYEKIELVRKSGMINCKNKSELLILSHDIATKQLTLF